MDYTILFVTLVLVLIGVVLVYDASYYTASTDARYEYDGMYFFRKQIIGALVGTVAMLIASRFDYKNVAKLKLVVYIVCMGLLALVLIPGIGVDRNGATRWLNIPVFGSFQPSEAAKFTVVLMASVIMTNRMDKKQDFKQFVLPVLVVCGSMIVMVVLQKSMSVTLLLAFLTFFMLFMGGAKGKHLWSLVGLGVLAVAGLLMFDLVLAPMLHPEQQQSYRFWRYLAFLDPFDNVAGYGWQLVQSLFALGSGGLFGVGFGQGMQKYKWLPYAESDFIFAIFAEEFGWIGCVLLLSLFAFLIWRGIRVALACEDRFGSLLAGGITTLIALQVIMHVAVVSASMPPTGVPLPFISAGNSSLVLFMTQIGILLNISRSTRA